MSLVVCFICNDNVSKRSTLAVSDGKRACRHHSQVKEMAQQLQQDHEEQSEQREIERTLRRMQRANNKLSKFSASCLICGEEGLRQDEFYLRWLITANKHEFLGSNGVPICDPRMMAATLLALPEQRCLYFCLWINQNTKISLSQSIRDVFVACQEVRNPVVFLACGKCCKARKIMTVTDENKSFPVEAMVVTANILDQMLRGSHV